ncbi:class I SAM-dependent methyltransferase [Enhygromyxa salina]|uniref:Trans-aconitate 2-methyltransferase n=1 Tax=Enhygromyxa salina TaxID=215803 RepID=A0A2S9YA62_9BACT|nr:class I SAM-dependent methyltransferase [Enhygromyxa salina]PRQ02004.1 trans-aconitate 2-methyltransferase [Enhygromyxa salina]
MPRSLLDIIEDLQAQLATGAQRVSLRVLDPDYGRGRFAGESVELEGERHIHRPLRVWVDLAERLGLRLSTPRPTADGQLELCFERLDARASWHDAQHPRGDTTEKYGVGSGFARVSKLEDPGFVLDLADALTRAKLGPAPRILDLGCNDGDVLTLIARLLAPKQPRFVGVDHSHSAIARARARLGDPAHRFIEADVNNLAEIEPELGRFDLALALSTLHSPGVDDRAILRQITKQLLEPNGTIIIGIPNCRYVDGELLHGARTKNFSQPELSLLIKSVAGFKRYLQQHRRRVYVTGKHYLLITGAPV